jgi:hypothetical protein
VYVRAFPYGRAGQCSFGGRGLTKEFWAPASLFLILVVFVFFTCK